MYHNAFQDALALTFVLAKRQYVDSETTRRLIGKIRELLQPTVQGTVYRVDHNHDPNLAGPYKARFGFRPRKGGDIAIPGDCYSFVIVPTGDTHFAPHKLYQGFRVIPTAMRCINASDGDNMDQVQKALEMLHSIITELLGSGEYTLSAGPAA